LYEFCLFKNILNQSLRFIHPSHTNSFLKAKLVDQETIQSFYEDLEEINKDLLLNCFTEHQKNEDYQKSGFICRNAVVVHIYLTKL
jgi:RNA polymerase-interacting CarD/CdnL/TRCF family regulator